jgi:hypothetical protein
LAGVFFIFKSNQTLTIKLMLTIFTYSVMPAPRRGDRRQRSRRSNLLCAMLLVDVCIIAPKVIDYLTHQLF